MLDYGQDCLLIGACCRPHVDYGDESPERIYFFIGRFEAPPDACLSDAGADTGAKVFLATICRDGKTPMLPPYRDLYRKPQRLSIISMTARRGFARLRVLR